jgi:hypothetical protein
MRVEAAGGGIEKAVAIRPSRVSYPGYGDACREVLAP